MSCKARLSSTRSYLSAVHSRVHDVYPALEDGHLEEGEVGVAHVVEVDVLVLPGEAEGEAGVPVGDEVGVGQVASVVQALGQNKEIK